MCLTHRPCYIRHLYQEVTFVHCMQFSLKLLKCQSFDVLYTELINYIGKLCFRSLQLDSQRIHENLSFKSKDTPPLLSIYQMRMRWVISVLTLHNVDAG